MQAVIRFLADSPVAGYAGFTEEEVRLVAAYMAAVSPGGYNFFWRSIILGYTEAWAYAVHEAAELQAFADMGINPFDSAQRDAHLEEAHLDAVVAELRFLRAWAMHLQIDAPELAIEMENPVRKQSYHHANLLRALQARMGYPDPMATERRRARQFWQQITQ
jgi:hypothetical protein